MKANYKSLFLIAENLAGLYEDGISIVMSLELLLDLPLNKEYKKSLVNIKSSIMKGNSLGHSFNVNPKLYPDFFSGIVDIGESSGELVQVLKSLKEFYFNIDKVRARVKSSIRYPLFVLSALIILSLVFFLFIIPSLYETFSVMNKESSAFVSFLYELYLYVTDNKLHSVFILLSFIAEILLITKYIKSNHREKEFKILLKIKFLREYYEYIFMMILSIIINSGIEISKGLDLCINSIDIICIKSAMEQLKEEVLMGNSIGESLEKVEFLSSYSLSMISLGEKSGNLDEILRKASSRLKLNLLGKLERLVSYVTPISIILISIVIVFFIFVFIVPMFDMVYSGVL